MGVGAERGSVGLAPPRVLDLALERPTAGARVLRLEPEGVHRLEEARLPRREQVGALRRQLADEPHPTLVDPRPDGARETADRIREELPAAIFLDAFERADRLRPFRAVYVEPASDSFYC